MPFDITQEYDKKLDRARSHFETEANSHGSGMPPPTSEAEIARLVLASRDGARLETSRLTELLYDELRKLAGSYLRAEGPGHTLQPTALVHEAFLRMASQRMAWQDRAHFMAIAASTMRRVLLDHARRRMAAKRGKGQVLAVTGPDPGDDGHALSMLALDDALKVLAEKDVRAARVVELHFFGGLNVAETADALGISAATAKRDWSFARAWLKRELNEVTGPP